MRLSPAAAFIIAALALPAAALAENEPTLCVASFDSTGEAAALRAKLAPGQGKVHDLLASGEGWLEKACSSKIQCDVVLLSGRFIGGFAGRSGQAVSLGELEELRCSRSCDGILKKARGVMLMTTDGDFTPKANARARAVLMKRLEDRGFPAEVAAELARQRISGVEAAIPRLRELFPSALVESLPLGDGSSKEVSRVVGQIVHDGKLAIYPKFTNPGDSLKLLAPAQCEACEAAALASARSTDQALPAFCDSLASHKSASSSFRDQIRSGSLKASSAALPSLDPLALDGEYPAALAPALARLSLAEIKALGSASAPAELVSKAREVARQIVVSDKHSRGARSTCSLSEKGEPGMRITQWNVARPEQFASVQSALRDCSAFARQLSKPGVSRQDWERGYRDACALAESDVLVLNEIDIGMCRSGNRNAVEELAFATSMRYAFTPEFIEVDPKHFRESAECAQSPSSSGAREQMHGNAVLSRYPMRDVERIDLECYDWFSGELARGPVDKTRAKGIELTFGAKGGADTELRRGSRNALFVTIETPAGPMLVVNAHLENKTTPACRADQLRQVIARIQARQEQAGSPMPVLLAGDLNTTGVDGTPVELVAMLKEQVTPKALALRGVAEVVSRTTPAGNALKVAHLGVTTTNKIRVAKDPSKRNIPFLFPNPERELFEVAAEYFDSSGPKGKWSATNERAKWGFSSTFETPRTYGPVGKSKLDWIFFQGHGKLEATGGETLDRVTQNSLPSASDHSPISVFVPMACQAVASP